MEYLLAGPEDARGGRLLVSMQSVAVPWTPRLGLLLSEGLRNGCPWSWTRCPVDVFFFLPVLCSMTLAGVNVPQTHVSNGNWHSTVWTVDGNPPKHAAAPAGNYGVWLRIPVLNHRKFLADIRQRLTVFFVWSRWIITERIESTRLLHSASTCSDQPLCLLRLLQMCRTWQPHCWSVHVVHQTDDTRSVAFLRREGHNDLLSAYTGRIKGREKLLTQRRSVNTWTHCGTIKADLIFKTDSLNWVINVVRQKNLLP